MFTGNYPQLMASYNRWMNQNIYAACEKLSDEERKRDQGAFFKSIHGTLNHILWGDRIWLERLEGPAFPSGPVGENLFDDFGELARARAELDAAIVTWAEGRDAAWLEAPMTWTSRLYKFTQTQPRWVLVVQMFNHQTHHRGQVHALLTRSGVDPGPTDVPVLPILHG